MQPQSSPISERGSADGLGKAVEEVKEDIGALGRDVSHLADAAKDEARAKLAATKEAVRRKTDKAAERVKSNMEGAAADMRAQVRHAPVISMGLAAAAGLAVGIFMFRR